MVTAYQEVDAPAVQPYRFGLESVAVPQPLEGHWMMGVEYEPISSYEAGVWPGICFIGAPSAMDLPDGVATIKGNPFSVWAGVDCSIVGYTEDYIVRRANAILKLGWQHAAEKELWSDPAGLGASLTNNGVNIGSGVSITDAVGLIESYLGDIYTGQVVIHANRKVAAKAANAHLLFERPGPSGTAQLQTALGSPFVFGGGYDGTGPSGAAPGSGNTWIYGTGVVTARRAEAFQPGGLPAALTRSTNVQHLFVEQQTVLTVDGPIVAVRVDLTK